MVPSPREVAVAVRPSPPQQEVTKCLHGAQTSMVSSCNSTIMPSPDRTQPKSVGSGDSEECPLNSSSIMPLAPELQEHLIGPLGVSGRGWMLPHWCEKFKHQLHDDVKGLTFAYNAGEGFHPDTFVPLCYAGSFGKVQFFCPKVGTTSGLPLGSFVAVKYKHSLLEQQMDVDRELDLLQECAGQHVVPMYMSARRGRQSWIVMPYVEHTLRTFIMGQNISCEDTASVFFQMAKGVEWIHDKRVFHRDLKLENMLVTRSGKRLQVFIADLGSACGGAQKWSGDNFATTLEYSAPEIWEKGLYPAWHRDHIRQRCSLACTYGEATDIWAATVILMQLLLRTVFIPGVMEKDKRAIAPFIMYLGIMKLVHNVEELIEAAGDLPDPVKALLRTGLQKEPEQRRGPERTGMKYILHLVMQWSAIYKSNVVSKEVDGPKVAELFDSSTNELAFQKRLSGRLPLAFEPILPPPGQHEGLAIGAADHSVFAACLADLGTGSGAGVCARRAAASVACPTNLERRPGSAGAADAAYAGAAAPSKSSGGDGVVEGADDAAASGPDVGCPPPSAGVGQVVALLTRWWAAPSWGSTGALSAERSTGIKAEAIHIGACEDTLPSARSDLRALVNGALDESSFTDVAVCLTPGSMV